MESSKAIISGLLNASEHALNLYKGRIRPLVFLREDIFSTLNINDLNKLKEDCGSILMWDLESLESMILQRINFYGSIKQRPKINSLSELFDRKEMRSRTTPVRYIYSKTFSRPRDIVAYFNRAIASMKEELPEKDSTRTQLSTDSLYTAENGYSDYLFSELSDEWKTQVLYFDIYMSSFENLGISVFKPDIYFEELSKKIPSFDRAQFRSTMRFLFENSIIGLKVGKSKNWRFKCFHPTQTFQDSDEYRIHPGLKKRLGLKDPKSNSADQDDEDEIEA